MARSPQTRELPTIPHFSTFASMLAKKLPLMYRLTIVASEWQLGTAHRNALLHLSTFTSITDLYLMGVRFPSKVVFARLVCALPSLAQITCIELSFRSKDCNPAAFSPTHPPVKTVHLDGPSVDVADVFADKLGLTIQHFSAGWFNYPRESPGDEAILVMVRRTGPVLRRLDIRLRQRPPGTPANQNAPGSSGRELKTGALFQLFSCDRCSLSSYYAERWRIGRWN